MDKKLELRLIESAYDPTVAKVISLQDAGRLIRDKIYGSTQQNPAGLVLFDGMTRAIVRTGLGHSILDKSSLAITNGDVKSGLFIYAPQDEMEKQRSSVFVETDGSYHIVVPERESYQSKDELDLIVKTENGMRDSAKVELIKAEDTKVLYLPPTDAIQRDQLFWQHIAGQFGLELTDIEPQYKGKSPWYAAADKRIGIDLTLGTRFRVYAVKTQFHTKKSAVDLRRLVDGLMVNPQTVDDSWNPEFSRGGMSCETHIDRGQGSQVVAYIGRLLERN